MIEHQGEQKNKNRFKFYIGNSVGDEIPLQPSS